MNQDSPESKPDSAKQKAPGLLRSTAVVSSMTLLSRVLGLVRDVVFARFFGAGLVMDAFFVAFKIPNIFRRFFAEGAFSQSFVPVFAEYDEKRSREEVKELVDRVSGTLGLILFVFTAVGVIAAPVLISIAGMGWLLNPQADSAAKFDLAVEMLRYTFPYLLFISLTALAGAVLNTYQRFAAAAFVPVLLNLVLIGSAAFVAPEFEQPGIVLAAGVFVAGLVQLLFMLPSLAKVRMLPRPKWGLSHEGVRRIAKLMLPAIFGSSVAQINILFDTLLASFLVTGSISWLYYSDRLMEFPLGVFGIALATVMLPNLSRAYANQSHKNFSTMLDWALRMVLLIAAPAAVGLFMLAAPALTTIFYGGRFGAADVSMASMSLMAYSFGLLGFTLVKVLVPGYFSRQDTKTPVRIGIIALLTNMVLNVVIVVPWYRVELVGPHAGLAIATSISAFINAGLLYRGLRRKGVLVHSAGWGRFLIRVVLACAVMAMLLNYFVPPAVVWLEASFWQTCYWLVAAVLGGAVAYLGVLFATGIRPAELRLKPPVA
ncbi:MAG: murein biosynthesis integral membrane protein MurJ [Gammaproteobacteria bacterium]|nr:murein biosynthesis integral membrane protein MurJ [Gammaproteobacteria bacterium]MCP4091002.1 murein biosynthesis integral membrane protein MurJ [Gammaproteobacteria bacterium]MCP4277472.1 murein biosynthesis integral membrane protein MurJ [Gammaproteobacteria bacterium]MCP4831467.1 murein biosynthesis integral membrane protein MurJ [Gammaproteobacteria bacterium]MCP4930093.1 murein biosynthesis integral membrane protein MurJ [Gammaproteobacteria bacterium]